MTDSESPGAPASGWRLKLGSVLLALSVVVPLSAVFVVGSFDLSPALTATLTAILLGGSEVLGLVAIAVLGKPGYEYIKARFFALLKRHGPPERVGPIRYRIGLVLFCLPLLFAWLVPYVGVLSDNLAVVPLPLALGADVLLLISLFVLGGEFWDKIRALFVVPVAAESESGQGDRRDQ